MRPSTVHTPASTAILALLLLSCGTDAGPPAFRPDPRRVLDDITTLASSAYEGRQGGLPGAERAVELIVRRFQQLGLETPANSQGYLQSFPLTVWNQTSATVFTIGDRRLVEGVDYMLLMYTDPASVTGELVFAGYGITVPPFSQAAHPKCPLSPAGFDEYAGIDVRDKTVVVVEWVPGKSSTIHSDCPASIGGGTETSYSSGDLSYKMANARARGARAIVTITPYYEDQRLIMYGFEPDETSRMATLQTDRDSLSVSLPSLRQWVMQIDGTLRPNSKMTGLQSTVEAGSYKARGFASNVIAVIPGSDPALKDQLVVIGSHLDHMGKRPNGDVYGGADDNAAGTAVMMELARSVVASGLRPARTLMFASYNAEELGLIGSCYYVKQQPLYPIANTKVMISVDMVGLGTGTGLDLYGATDEDKGWIARVMANSSAAMGMSYEVKALKPMLASDHACFASDKGSPTGIPAVMALSTAMSDHPAYHTPRDTAAAISQPAIKASLELMWAFLVPVAMGTESKYDTAGAALVSELVDAAPERHHPLFRGR
jgi:hypothetical protein